VIWQHSANARRGVCTLLAGDGERSQNCAPYMGSGRGWLSMGGSILNITVAAWTVGFHRWCSGNIMRTQNVNEYMLVLALCLVCICTTEPLHASALWYVDLIAEYWIHFRVHTICTISRISVSKISRNLNPARQSVLRWIHSEQNFENFPVIGRFIKKTKNI